MVGIDQVHSAARLAQQILARLESGILDQIAVGKWDEQLSKHISRIDVLETLEDLRESERLGRVVLNDILTGSRADEPSPWPAWDDPSLGYRGDDRRGARYRAWQSRWRETVLHLPPGRSDGGALVGNMLRADAPRDAQWLTPEVTEYARARLAWRDADDAPFNDRRLLRNLLSSMPLCFNVFGHLDAHRDAAARVLSTVLNMDIAQVGPVRVEHTPAAAHARLHDRTAFDAFVPYRTSRGEEGFLAVETKYTETFSPTEYDKQRYVEVTNADGSWFREGAGETLRAAATNQLWRNTMLAQLTEQLDYSGAVTGSVLVLALQVDDHADAAMTGVAAWMKEREQASRLRRASFEHLRDAALVEPELAYWAHLFSARYLPEG